MTKFLQNNLEGENHEKDLYNCGDDADSHAINQPLRCTDRQRQMQRTPDVHPDAGLLYLQLRSETV
jgi:hypothetical protein